VSIVGVILFFFIIYDLFSTNNLFFQLNNNVYLMALNSRMEGSTVFSAFKGLYSGAVSFYIFNKYSFFNAFNFKFSYTYLSRLLWLNFFNAYGFFFLAYASTYSSSFFNELHRYAHKHFVPALSLFNESSDFDANTAKFNKLFNFRFFYYITDLFVYNKALFFILKALKQLDNISFFK